MDKINVEKHGETLAQCLQQCVKTGSWNTTQCYACGLSPLASMGEVALTGDYSHVYHVEVAIRVVQDNVMSDTFLDMLLIHVIADFVFGKG